MSFWVLSLAAYQTVKELTAAALEEKGFRPGMVSIVQTFGGQANFNPHVHALCSRGASLQGPSGGLKAGSAKGFSLLAVTLDTTRPDQLGCYGEHYDDRVGTAQGNAFPAGRNERNAEQVTKVALDWLRARQDMIGVSEATIDARRIDPYRATCAAAARLGWLDAPRICL